MFVDVQGQHGTKKTKHIPEEKPPENKRETDLHQYRETAAEYSCNRRVHRHRTVSNAILPYPIS